MKFVKISIFLSVLLLTYSSFAQKDVVISKGEFYRKTVVGIEKTNDYLSGDSTFMLQMLINTPDTFNVLSVAWYFDGDGVQNARIDTASYGLRNLKNEVTVSFTRKSYTFPVGFYFVNIYLDGKFKEKYSFRVLSEPVISAQFLKVKNNEKISVEKWDGSDANLYLRVFFDRFEVLAGSELKAVFFFELPNDEPLFLNEVNYTIESDYNYVDFPLYMEDGLPTGYLVAEIWVDGQFKKYFSIQVE